MSAEPLMTLRGEDKRRENPSRDLTAPVLVAMEKTLRSPEGRPAICDAKRVANQSWGLLRGSGF